jgi:hypothetical protein
MNDNQIIIVTGFKNIADHCSPTGWTRQLYARTVKSLSEIEDGEELWTGTLCWTDADPEGRHPAGWRIDHNGRLLLVIEDREAAEKISFLREEIKTLQEAVRVAHKGHIKTVWDDRRGWVDIPLLPSEEEVQRGKEAQEKLPVLIAELEKMMTRHVDGAKHRDELAALRAQRKAQKEAAARAGDISAMPWEIRDLISCLQGSSGSYVTVNVEGELAWQASYKPHYTARKKDLAPYWDFLANLASSCPEEKVRKWFSK